MADLPSFREKLCFLAEWHDSEVAYRKKFILNYYLWDGTIELFDRELNRMFLKRTKMETIGLEDMFIGSRIRILGRLVKITDSSDRRTAAFIEKTRKRTLALLKPLVVDKLGEIIVRIQQEGFTISKLRMCLLTRKEGLDFYAHRVGQIDLPFVVENIVSGPVVAMELVGEDAVERWKKLMGPKEPIEARKTDPDSLRALHGLDSNSTNGFHGSDTSELAAKEIEFFFPEEKGKSAPGSSVLLENTTCCVVKPHAVHEGKLGHIISCITNSHFKVTAAQMMSLSSADAAEFLEVYKGVVSDYNALVGSFLDGPCVALEIAGKVPGMDVHGEFRRFCGPPDPEVAKYIRPDTLRGRFGCDINRNAVHCTDLPEDTTIDLQYLFRVVGE